MRWFEWLCERRGLEPRQAFHATGAAPFHRRAEAAVQPSGARPEAGFPSAYYEDLACAGARC